MTWDSKASVCGNVNLHVSHQEKFSSNLRLEVHTDLKPRFFVVMENIPALFSAV